jgi:hypothetical protein
MITVNGTSVVAGPDDILDVIAIAQADVVEWPRLSQAVRLEREQATHSYSVRDDDGNERGIFYTLEAGLRFAARYNFYAVDRKPILRQFP